MRKTVIEEGQAGFWEALGVEKVKASKSKLDKLIAKKVDASNLMPVEEGSKAWGEELGNTKEKPVEAKVAKPKGKKKAGIKKTGKK